MITTFDYTQFPRLDSFTDEDRRACLPTVKFWYDAALLARDKGLPELENLTADTYFLEYALELLTDGVQADALVAPLRNLILSSPHEGAELLKRVLTLKGAYAVARGANPGFVWAKLSSFLGEAQYAEPPFGDGYNGNEVLQKAYETADGAWYDAGFDHALFPPLVTFTDEDRRACLPAVKFWYDAAVLTRQQGLLGLSDLVRYAESPFLKAALGVLYDAAANAAQTRDILQTLLLSSAHSGAELLRRIVITEGALLVARGENPRSLYKMLLTLLGEDICAEVCRDLGY